MKLSQLDASFIQLSPPGQGGNRVSFRTGVSYDEADGILFLCPLCFVKQGGPVGTHSIVCWFTGKVPDTVEPLPGRWDRSGSSLDDLAMSPSIQCGGGEGGCGWHGFIHNGEAS